MKTHKVNKKGQLNIGDAPAVIITVGFIFLMLATLALVANEYGNAMPDGTTYSVSNETITTTERGSQQKVEVAVNPCATNFADAAVVNATTGASISSGNWTLGSTTGIFQNTTGSIYNASSWELSYTYTVARGCNITADLESEIEDNVSLTGVVLTIALVGIVLTILIGIFVGFTRGSV
jgi:hypothetical protein